MTHTSEDFKMLKEFIMISEQEKKEIEDWMNQTYGDRNNHPIDALFLILYKIHQLEEKITTIEEQTRTHWIK